MSITVRPATEGELAGLAKMDLTYPTGRLLSLKRSGAPPELSFEFRWRDAPPGEAVYGDYTEDGLRRALTRPELFIMGEVDAQPAGLLMIVLAGYTDAGEITDLAVHRPLRRRGVGRALVQASADWARDRGLRALWVEPRADNAEAIGFYMSLEFRMSGFNDRLYANGDHEAGRPTLYFYLEL